MKLLRDGLIVLVIAAAGFAMGHSCAGGDAGEREVEVAQLKAVAGILRDRGDSLAGILAHTGASLRYADSIAAYYRQAVTLEPTVIRIPGEPIPPETVTVVRDGGPVPVEIPGEVGDVIRSCDALRVTCEQYRALAGLTLASREAEADTLRRAVEELSKRPTRSRWVEGAAIGGGIAIALYQLARLLIGKP